MIDYGIIKKSVYIKMIYQIMAYLQNVSIVKLVMLCFCFRHCLSDGDNLSYYKYDVFIKSLNRFGSKIRMYKEDFFEIFNAIDILRECGYIDYSNDHFIKTEKVLKNIDVLDIKQTKICNEVKRMDDIWFMEEIVNHV